MLVVPISERNFNLYAPRPGTAAATENELRPARSTRLTPPKILQSPWAPGHALADARSSAVLRISSKNHSGKGRKSEKLPKDLETFVQAEFLIASHHRDLFRQSLGDDLTAEGIRVQERQIEKRECMVRSVR